MSQKSIYTATVPAWAAPIIANADYSNLEEGEQEIFEKFVSSLENEFGQGYLVLGEKVSDFGCNEVDAYMGEVYEATYLVNQ